MYRMIALISAMTLTLAITSTASATTWKQKAAQKAGVGRVLFGAYPKSVDVGKINLQTGTVTKHSYKIVNNGISGKTIKPTTTVVHYGVGGATLGQAVKYKAGMGGTPVASSADTQAEKAGRKASVQIKKLEKQLAAPFQYLGQLLKGR